MYGRRHRYRMPIFRYHRLGQIRRYDNRAYSCEVNKSNHNLLISVLGYLGLHIFDVNQNAEYIRRRKLYYTMTYCTFHTNRMRVKFM